jgi:hypothetical protein
LCDYLNDTGGIHSGTCPQVNLGASKAALTSAGKISK